MPFAPAYSSTGLSGVDYKCSAGTWYRPRNERVTDVVWKTRSVVDYTSAPAVTN